MNLDNVTPELMQNYSADLGGSASIATLKRRLSSLRKFFEWAESAGHVQNSPFVAPPSLTTPASTQTSRKRSILPFSIFKWIILAAAPVIAFLLVSKLQFPIPFRFAPASTPQDQIVMATPDPEPTTIPISPTPKPTDIPGGGDVLIEGDSITLRTSDTTDGDLVFNPDGRGGAIFLFESPNGNNLSAQNANLTSGSLFYGLVANNATGYNLLTLQSGASPTTKFAVDAKGNTTVAGNLNLTSGNLQIGGITRFNNLGRLASITGYYQDSGLFEIDQGGPDFARITKSTTATADVLTLTLNETGKTSSNQDTLVLNRLNPGTSGYALFVESGNVAIEGNIVPNTTNTWSLGSTTQRWKNVYATDGNFSNSVAIGGSLLVEGATLATSGDLSTSGSLEVDGNTTLGDASSDIITVNGQGIFKHIPASAHTGTWVQGSGTWNVSDSTVYINPASSVGDGNLLGLAVNGSVMFSVDAEGDIFGKNLVLTGTTTTGTTNVVGDLTVEGNTTLGDASGDTMTFNASTLAIPNNLNIDSNTLYIDAATDRVGIGDSGPDAKLEVLATTEQLRLTHTDGTIDARFTLDGNGDLTIDGSSDGTGNETLTFTGFTTLTTALTNFDCTDCLDFADFEDTLDLDTALTLNQTTNTWSQTFTGDTTTGYTYTASSLTSGTANLITTAATAFTGSLVNITSTGGNASNTGTLLRASAAASDAVVPLMLTNLGTGASFRVNDETGDADTSPFLIHASGNVAIGTTTDTYKLHVFRPSTDSSGTTIYSQVEGAQSVAHTGVVIGINSNPTYTAASGNTLATFFGMQSNPVNSSTGTVTTLQGMRFIPQNNSTGTVGTLMGLQAIPQNNSTGTVTSLYGGQFIPQNTAGGTVTTIIGAIAIPNNASSGTVTSMYGLYGNPINSGSGTTSSMIGVQAIPQKTGTGNVTTVFGLHSRIDNSNASGTIGTAYNIYIAAPVETGTISNKYAFVSEVGAGNFGIGTIAPTNQFVSMQSGATQVAAGTGTTTGVFANDSLVSGTYVVAITTDDASAADEYFLVMQSEEDSAPDNEFLFRTNGTLALDNGTLVTPADIAEMYSVNGYSEAGDLVAVAGAKSVSLSAGKTYDSNVMGIVSTQPGHVLGYGDADDIDPKNDPRQPIALAGRVPVKVSLQNGTIKKGDRLTSSSLPGVAMKATKPGPVVAIALEDYDGSQKLSAGTIDIENERLGLDPANQPLPVPPSGVGKIMGFVNIGNFEPEANLAEKFGTTVDHLADAMANGASQVYREIGGFGELIAKGIKATTIDVEKLIASNKIISPTIETSVISPVPDEKDIAIKIGNPNASESGQLLVKNKDDVTVASIDEKGNANFIGELKATNIYGQNIEEIEEILKKVDTNNQELLEASKTWTTEPARNASSIADAGGSGSFVNLTVLKNTILSDTLINGKLNVGTLVFDNINNSINAAGVLKLQDLALAPIEAMAGKFIIDTEGNVKIAGNIEVAGNIKTDKVIIASQSEASQSAQVVDNIIETNATAGVGTIKAGVPEITIKNQNITNYTLVYVTPTSDTQNQVLYIKEKAEGYFKVGFLNPIDTDATFNWWVIELE